MVSPSWTVRSVVLFAMAAVFVCVAALGQENPQSNAPRVTMLEHPDTRYWISGQDNIIWKRIRHFPRRTVVPIAFEI
jgi:hypothetical protein